MNVNLLYLVIIGMTIFHKNQKLLRIYFKLNLFGHYQRSNIDIKIPVQSAL